MTSHLVTHLEIAASDPNEAAEFYKEVFGWKIEVDGNMNYVQFLAEEGGIGGAFTEVSESNPAGTVLAYVTTDDIEVSLGKIEANGGNTIMPKTEIPGFGHFAVFADATGGTLGLFSGNPEANPEG
jgi:predicted enzyme related to lactoylglutathione lyase